MDSLVERIIRFTAAIDLDTNKEPFAEDVREVYREGLDHGEIMFARRLLAAIEKKS
jgi:hypothetical protein